MLNNTYSFIIYNMLFILSVITLSHSTLNASEKSNSFTAGVRTSYLAGTTDSYSYYQPYISAKIYIDRFTLRPGFSRMQGYQLTDGAGNYEYVNINKLGAEIDYEINDSLEAVLSYNYAFGESGYILHDYMFEMNYYCSTYSISASYTGRKTEYKVGSANISEDATMLFAEYSHYLGDISSLDFSYEYRSTSFTGSADNYTVNTVRGGYSTLAGEALILTFGINIGNDSADYITAGVDAGITIKAGENIKVSLFYLGSHNAQLDSLISSDIKEGGKKSSPFLDPDVSGDSYISHTVSGGVSYTF